MIAWYTTAWFDRYVKGDPTATARLLTDRWRGDAEEAAVDPGHDGNMFSFYYRSRLEIGGFDCEDLRTGCPGMAPDGGGPYSYLGRGHVSPTPPARPRCPRRPRQGRLHVAAGHRSRSACAPSSRGSASTSSGARTRAA